MPFFVFLLSILYNMCHVLVLLCSLFQWTFPGLSSYHTIAQLVKEVVYAFNVFINKENYEKIE